MLFCPPISQKFKWQVSLKWRVLIWNPKVGDTASFELSHRLSTLDLPALSRPLQNKRNFSFKYSYRIKIRYSPCFAFSLRIIVAKPIFKLQGPPCNQPWNDSSLPLKVMLSPSKTSWSECLIRQKWLMDLFPIKMPQFIWPFVTVSVTSACPFTDSSLITVRTMAILGR